MKKFILMATMALFCISVSAQCPEKKGDGQQQTEQCCKKKGKCCKKKKGDCCKKKAEKKKKGDCCKNDKK